jgi:hypothetical protein
MFSSDLLLERLEVLAHPVESITATHFVATKFTECSMNVS